MAGPFYEPSKYHVQILDVALGEASTGNPQIVLRVKVISRLFQNSSGEEASAPVAAQYDRTIYLTVTEKSRELILAKLRWAGWQGDRFESLTSDIAGNGVRAECKHENSVSEKYRGQLTEKWDLELPPLASKPLENKPAVAKKLNALFGKMLKEGKPAPSGGPPSGDATGIPAEVLAAAGQSGSGVPADEIPFACP